MSEVNQIVACPDCHRECGWCAWYAKNARTVGCGLRVTTGLGSRRSKQRCEWDALRGTTCPTCGGSEHVRLIGHYEALARTDAPKEPA